jgi:hypothetical protein
MKIVSYLRHVAGSRCACSGSRGGGRTAVRDNDVQIFVALQQKLH